MAGDWIKIEEVTPDKPEVWQMAVALKLEPDAIMGKLVRVWILAGRICHGDGVTDIAVIQTIDRVTATPGFSKAMIDVEWLAVDADKLVFVDFDKHCSKTAKDRALAYDRKKRQRENDVNNDTKGSRVKRDETVTRDRDRDREYKETPSMVPPGGDKTEWFKVHVLPWTAGEKFDHEAVLQWYDHFESNGWKISGKAAMKNWQSSLRNWVKREAGFGKKKDPPDSDDTGALLAALQKRAPAPLPKKGVHVPRGTIEGAGRD